MTNCMEMVIIDNSKYEYIFENQGVTWGIYKDSELKYIYCEIEDYVGERDIQYLYALVDLNDSVLLRLFDPLIETTVYNARYVSPYSNKYYNNIDDFIVRETNSADSFYVELK